MKFSSIYIFIIRILSLIIIRKHTLISLLRLEFIIISLLFSSILYCLLIKYSIYLFILIITFLVCEGVLGLRILVNIIRCQGNDFINSIILW